jgi:hypothetical protein
MLRAVFRLALRQTEGLIGAILHLLGLDLPVPDHSTIGRCAKTTGLTLCRPGEWLVEKHGTKKRHSWKKLHIGLATGSGRIVAATPR